MVFRNLSGAGCKVTKGYDFVGDAFTGSGALVPDSDPMDCVRSLFLALVGSGLLVSLTLSPIPPTLAGWSRNAYASLLPFSSLRSFRFADAFLLPLPVLRLLLRRLGHHRRGLQPS
jgi:hypothetical protein